MKRWICLIVCVLLAGCVFVEEEKKSAVLVPYKIEYEKPLPALNENVDYAQKNSSFVSVFSMDYESVGMSVSQEGKKQLMDIWEWTDNSKTVVYTTYGIPFYEGQSIQLTLDVSSDIADTVSVIFDDYTNVFYQNSFSLSDQSRKIRVDYTHAGGNLDDAMIKVVFSKANQKNTGQVVMSQMKLSLPSNNSVKVNQLGYLPLSQKLCVFRYNSGDWFDVVNANTNEVVYTGQIVGRVDNSDTGEVNYYGDFTSVSEPGTYYIESQFGGRSYEFEIGEDLYAGLLEDALGMLTLQRCGTALSEEAAGAFSHESCHHALARSYSTWEDLDVSGGWHDAGDYGRYTLTAVKTMNDLMLSYYVYPESFDDAMSLLNSGNGLPDVLDEARAGLDWLKKMQNSWGGIYTAAVTTQFADFVLPNQDEQQLWLLDVENTSTASGAGAFAMGAIVFKEADPELSQEYLECAKKSYGAAIDLRGQQDKKNPSEISAGDYANASDADEIYFAAAMMYAATHDEAYLEEIEKAVNSSIDLFGLSYDQFGGYGTYFLLQDEQFQKTDIYPDLYNLSMKHAQDLVWDNVNDGYHLAIDSYHWGANMDVCNNAMMMLLINDINPSSELVDSAFEQLSYLLGKNSLNMSFVSGYGNVYPKNIHHRIAEVRSAELKGALVGGPDGSLESDLPAAKKYWDDANSYSTNEVAVYYNSPLVFVLSAFQ